MKTTVDIPENELKDAMRFTKAKTKREAVVRILEEFNHRQRMGELVKYSGTFSDSFSTNDEIEAVDAKRDLLLHGRRSRR
jgi:Ca2+-binding EF-hand superfamily protein